MSSSGRPSRIFPSGRLVHKATPNTIIGATCGSLLNRSHINHRPGIIDDCPVSRAPSPSCDDRPPTKLLAAAVKKREAMSTLRIRNAALNEQEYLSGKTFLTSKPTMLFVELTQNCNLSCRMCRAAGSYDPALNMKQDVFEQATAELFPYATMVDLRGWGESTILKDFDKRLRTTLETGVRVRLVTNAIPMTEKLWEMFFEGDNEIVVSLDSASAETFSKLGRGDLNRVLRNLRQGVAARDRAGKGEIYLNVVVSMETLDEMVDIVRLAAEQRLKKVVFTPIRTHESNPSHLRHGVDKIPGRLDEVTRIAQKLDINVELGAALDRKFAVKSGLPGVCSNPWSHVVIDYQGRVGYCDHLIGHQDCVLGSLKQNSFEVIWNSPFFQYLRAEHLRARSSRKLPKLFQRCTWCYSNRYSDTEAPYKGSQGRKVSTRKAPLYQIAATR
jgi:radical SAM protein with 4Fe4S-binding SPASM domain